MPYAWAVRASISATFGWERDPGYSIYREWQAPRNLGIGFRVIAEIPQDKI